MLNKKNNLEKNKKQIEFVSKGKNYAKVQLLFRSPIPLISLIILVFFIFFAIFIAPFLFEIANRQNLQFRFYKPFNFNAGFWFILGGDGLGRPMLAQIIYGARASFFVAGATVVISSFFGLIIGIFSGFKGGMVDIILLRIADIIVTLPSLLLALAILYILGSSVSNLIIVLSIARLPVFLRTARVQTLSIKESTFIEVSRSIGSKEFRIMWKNICPLVLPTIMTIAMLELGNVMLAVSGLSFLGVGLQRPYIDWGSMVAEGRQYITVAPWITVIPGLVISIAALSANLLSNWLRALTDPIQSNRMYAKLWEK